MNSDLGPDLLLTSIRDQNLGAYVAMPSRIEEDVAQESQIAQDYRGRLTFELLQNADDAMAGGGFDERIRFVLTDDALEVGNSGRALTPQDVAGLCGTGASSKVRSSGRRRASIGHKGMGFKSVLEITDQPEVVSDTYSFRLDADLTKPEIDSAIVKAGFDARARVPTMRLPWPLGTEPATWSAAKDAGFHVLFRFPLRSTLSRDQRRQLAQRLLDLPVTAILFLKHLDDVEVDVRTRDVTGHFRWRLSREVRDGDAWVKVGGFGESGVYRVRIVGDNGTDLTFVVAHDADVEIGDHRSGLDGAAWDDIDLTEVSCAVPWPAGTSLPMDWAKFHVFLPTEEASPYPMLINGAFRTDLSRQHIAVRDDDLDYNHHLLRATATVFKRRLLPALLAEGVEVGSILELLDRTRVPGARSAGGTSAALHAAFREALADVRFIPGELGLSLTFAETVVPPSTPSRDTGAAFRELLPPDATFGDRWFPTAALCMSSPAAVLADFGSATLAAADGAPVLAGADPERAWLRPHPIAGARLSVDPVLEVLGHLWAELRGKDRAGLEQAVRGHALFPVSLGTDGSVRRARSSETQCFYPPRGLLSEPPLQGLEFMLQQVCWGDLTSRERNELLHDEMVAWQGLFGIREFKFPDVMRASVFPALELERSPDAEALRVKLQDVDRIAAICQLAGPSAKAANPLPHERLGSNRVLFNLSRLRLPCRLRENGIERWEPAYRIYFGSDWIGDASVERVLDAARAEGMATPDIPFLASPETFVGRLEQYQHLARVADDDSDDAGMEVAEDEDEDAALESSEGDRWMNFLTWLGVNRVLRPVSFHDVMDSGSGWLSTADLGRPRGWAFTGLGEIWDEYQQHVQQRLGQDGGAATRYFYELHDLDHVAPLLGAAGRDASGSIARALFGHLAVGWPQLSPRARLGVAISSDRAISKRTPPKANDDELRYPTDNFWVFRLKAAGWVPSTHGPRVGRRVWWRSSEVIRRFGRSGAGPGDLLPLLEIDEAVPAGRAETLAQVLAVRAELNPAHFDEDDARALLERIEARFAPDAEAGTLDDRTLREVVRPAYRNLLELMSGVSGDEEEGDATTVVASLADAPVLVHDGAGTFRFVPGREALYVSRSGTRERLGQPSIETFVLETSVTARRALRTLGIRTLEAVLEWVPQPGEPALDEESLNAFSTGLAELAPFVLARLRADRSDERTAQRDANRLRALLGNLEPVDSLALECRLDGQRLLKSDARDAHVVERDDGLTAFVRWGARGWPPTRAEANALATVLVDGIGAGAFEMYVALVSATSSEERFRLLRYAGAPTDLREFRDILFGGGDVDSAEAPADPIDGLKTPASEGQEWLAGASPEATDGRSTVGRIPLYRPDQLLIGGEPITVTGEQPSGPGAPSGGEGPQGGRSANYGSTATDLDELNAVGMWVALSFERHRLHLAGHTSAEVFVSGSSDEDAWVFDVSTQKAIEDAAHGSSRFRTALQGLERHGLSRAFPGFDILTLDPRGDVEQQRLIELKSSGVDAQVQSMTWNEWKTARDSTLRSRFFLYLVSNLRSDLGDRVPYLRAIRDPFGSLWNQEVVESGMRRSVQLNVRQFLSADELPIQVQPRS